MSGGCTDCGRKGGCDHRKGAMFEAIDQALGRLYPTKRWGERDEDAAFRAGVAPGLGHELAERLAQRLKSVTMFRPGGSEETCDYVWVLCVGRPPALLELLDAPDSVSATNSGWAAAGEVGADELYLRVVLSTIAPFAAVQQVAMRLGHVGQHLVLTQDPRAGVFDPVLLARFQRVVAVLAELDVRHLDFGEIAHAPPGFDGGDYDQRYGAQPTIANYLFFPQPPGTSETRLIALAEATWAREKIELPR